MLLAAVILCLDRLTRCIARFICNSRASCVVWVQYPFAACLSVVMHLVIHCRTFAIIDIFIFTRIGCSVRDAHTAIVGVPRLYPQYYTSHAGVSWRSETYRQRRRSFHSFTNGFYRLDCDAFGSSVSAGEWSDRLVSH